MKKKVAFICPGRGTYNKSELGYLQKYHSDKIDLFKYIDKHRSYHTGKTILELDASNTFSNSDFFDGRNAAPLIFSCTYADFKSIDTKKFEVIAISGNSMGWYSALAISEVLSLENSSKLISSMGAQLGDNITGSQLIYPLIDDSWNLDENKVNILKSKIRLILDTHPNTLYDSINFGGYSVIGGSKESIDLLANSLPKTDDIYPLKLPGHSAFHTPLLNSLSQKSKKIFHHEMFSKPKLPLIDGQGKIWETYSSSPFELWNYTLGAQINSTYNFTLAIEVIIKEFSPDYIFLGGPGTTMGGAIAQTLIHKKLRRFTSKSEFKMEQNNSAYLINMGDQNQRGFAIGN